MIHPSARAAVALAAGAPLVVAAALAAPTLWLFGVAWLGVVLAAFAIDALALLSGPRVHVETRCPASWHVGERETATLVLRGQRRSPLEVLVDVEGPAAPIAPVSLAANAETEVSVPLPIRTERRGVVRLAAVWLRSSGPLGLATRNERRGLGVEVPVVPNIVAVKRQALAFAAADAPLGTKPQHQKGSGTEFEALREHTAGMDTRAIDWKHSARHRALVCKEFQTERNHHVVLALDTGRLMGEVVDGVTKLDRACTALLLLSYVSLKAGDRVGFCAFDDRTRAFLTPTGGMSTLAHVQRALAALDYRLEETNFTLALSELAERLTRRSLVIIATDFVDTVTAGLMVNNVGHLAKRHLVLFVALAETSLTRQLSADLDGLEDVARAVVAHDLLRERRTVFARLARLGVLCMEAPVEQLGPELINRYLAIKTGDLI